LIALVIWAVTVLAASVTVLHGGVPVVLGALAAAHGFLLEVSRHRLERRLRPPASMAEAVEG
jgi:Flp pilus assembly protein TadB